MEKLHGRIDGVNSFALGDQRKVIGTNKPIRKPGSMGDQVFGSNWRLRCRQRL